MDKKEQSMLAAMNIMMRNKRKKYAEGGGIINNLKKTVKHIQDFSNDVVPPQERSNETYDSYDRDSDPTKRKVIKENRFADGGEVDGAISDSESEHLSNMSMNPEDESDNMLHKEESLVEAIMNKRKKMADGGEVDGSMENILKENYSEDMDDINSIKYDSDLSSDEADMISQIRSKMRRQRQSKG